MQAAPVIDVLVLTLLRAALGDDRVGSEQPVDVMDRLPWVVARVVVPGDSPDIRFGVARGTVQVDVYAADLVTAYSMADGARLALVGAWQSHSTVNGAVIQRVTGGGARKVSTAGQPSGLSRVVATFGITARSTT